MNTDYGKIPDEAVVVFLHRLTGRVFKILPMKEEECNTLQPYVENLLRELINTKNLVEELKHEGDFLSLISTLDGVKGDNVELSVCKSDVFKCLDIIKKMIDKIERG